MDTLKGCAALVLRYRLPVLALIGVATAFFGYHALHLRFGADFAAWVPRAHPYAQVQDAYGERFGRASVVTIMIEVGTGSIFTVETLNKLWNMTAALATVAGIDSARIVSIAHPSARHLRVGAGGTLRAQAVMSGPIARADEVDAIKRIILDTDYLRGLVSPDGSAAVIRAEVGEERTDDARLLQEINERVVAPFSDAATRVSVAGQPILSGWTQVYARGALVIYAATALVLWFSLGYYFRDWRGALHPTLSGVMAAVWGLGVLQLVGLRLDPLGLVIPVFLTARAISHAVHLHARYVDASLYRGDMHAAIVDALAARFVTTLAGLGIDASAILVLVLVSMVLLQKLAVAACIWLAAIAVAELLLAPSVFSYLPPTAGARAAPRWSTRLMIGYARVLLSRTGRRIAAAAAVLVLALSAYGARPLVTGAAADTRVLAPDAPYTSARRAVEHKFGGLESLIVVAEGYEKNAMKEPETLRAMERLQSALGREPAIGASVSLADVVRPLNAVFHEYEPKWGIIPREAADVAGLFGVFFTAVPPEAMRAVDPSFTAAPLTFWCRDLTAATVRRVVGVAQRFIARSYVDALGIAVVDTRDGAVRVAGVRATPGWELEGAAWVVADRSASREGPFHAGDRIVAVGNSPVGSVAELMALLTRQAERSSGLAFTLQRAGHALDLTVRAPWKAVFRLGGGRVGELAAANEAVAHTNILVLILGLAAVYLGLVLACRSGVAAVYLLLPVVMGNVVVQAYLAARDLGPSLATLPLVAVGVGFGVDYGLYIVRRVSEELQTGCDVLTAVERSLATAGSAVMATAGSMAAAMFLWRLSALRVDAEMGLALALWITASGVTALSVLPVALVMFEPRFITAGTKKRGGGS
jgi:predicted RND superfamily exporter protein